MPDITGRVHTIDTYRDRLDRGHIIEGWAIDGGIEHHFTLLVGHNAFQTLIDDAGQNIAQADASVTAIDDHDRAVDQRLVDGAA